MYLWIVIATFVVALFSYNISVHPDVDRVYSQTRAKTVSASFVIQHNALVKYIQSVGAHLSEQQFTQDENGDYTVSNDPYLSGTYYPNKDGQFSSGALDASLINSFLPPGFEIDKQMISKIYCFKRFEAPIPGAEGISSVEADPVTGQYPFDYSDDSASCTKTSKVMLVSWRQIPQKWINRRDTSMPSPDMIHAIARTNGYGTTFGYTEHHSGNQTDYYISGGEQKVYDAVADDSSGPNLNGTCSKIPCFIAISQIKY